LPHQRFAHPVAHEQGLVVDRSHRDKAHGRARDRLGNRGGIGGVILLPAD